MLEVEGGEVSDGGEFKLRAVHMAFAQIPPDTGAMAVMGADGDTKYIWDKTKPVEVEAARKQFYYFTKDNGYLAFAATGDDGHKGDQIREFDPNIERIIFAPQMRGG